MPHPELLGQDGDGSVPGEDRPQLAAGAGRLHLRQGKQTHRQVSGLRMGAWRQNR